MANTRRTETNRENSAHSTGPRTEEGKDHSKFNALSHGLASNYVILPYESQEEYNALKASYEENHQPGSVMEVELLGRMVDSIWRLQRANRFESQFFIQREKAIAGENEGLGGDAALTLLFTDPKEMARLRLFMRYLASAERASTRATADFEKAKKARLQAEAELPVAETGQTRRARVIAAIEAGFAPEPRWGRPCDNPEDEKKRMKAIFDRDRDAARAKNAA